MAGPPSDGDSSVTNNALIAKDEPQSAVKSTSGELDTTPTGPNEVKYPPLRTVIMIMLALYITMFLVALDRIIIATAIPRITDAFHAIDDIGWYTSAYVLAAAATQLLWGRVYTFYDNKLVFLAAVGLFEVGSALCGAAPSSVAFILGRAIAGAGSSGVFSGVVVIMIPLAPLEKRSMYQGLLGGVFGVSSVVGPLVGGAFTSSAALTWRWCFYINLPVGAVSVLVIVAFLRVPPAPLAALPPLEKLRRMDPLGCLLFLPCVVCLLLALQWGGTAYPWRSARVVALLVVSAVLLAAWLFAQRRGGDRATVPPRLFGQRSIAAAFGFSCCVGGVLLPAVSYVAIWFQAVKGVDALESGVRTIPLVLGITAASVLAGAAVGRLGYYAPFVYASACLMPVGAGLLTLLRPGSGHARWIGSQAALGLGLGLGMQAPGLAAQTVLAPADIPTGVAITYFGQSLGGAVFVCVAQSVFLQRLASALATVLPRDQVARILAAGGATELRAVVPPALLPAVLVQYNRAVTAALFVAVGVACFSVVPAAAFEWRSVKEARRGRPGGGREGDVEAGQKPQKA